MNLVAAPPAVTSRPRGTAWPAGARSWFLAALSLVLAANVMFSRYLFADSFYDLYAGRYVVQHGMPHQDVVTVAAHGTSWIDQQWLAQVLYYGAWAAGGYRALAALSAALVTSGFAVLALLMLRRGVPPPRVFAWTLAAFAVCMGNTGIRAQSFAYPCFALTLWLIVADGRAPRLRGRTWLIIPVLVLWANTHGSVLLGAGLVVIYAGYRVVKAWPGPAPGAVCGYLALGAAAAATVVCTPYGIAVLGYYRRFTGNPVLAHNIVEWARPSPLDPFSWAFFLLVLGTVIAVTVAWRRGTRPDPILLGLAVLLLTLAATAVRDQAWFAFGGSLLAADVLARSGSGRGPAFGAAFRRAMAGSLAVLALTGLGVLAVTPDSQFDSEIPQRAINLAAALAAKNPAARVLGDDWAGTPMLWLHPAMFGRVAFDIRVEQYSSQQISAYFDFLFVRGPRWQRVMSGYQIVAVSRREHARLANALGRLPGWRVVYQDHDGLVLLRRAGT
jgi:hypothetical protein